jgi:tetratricopeptide (TPR) repeat protein
MKKRCLLLILICLAALLPVNSQLKKIRASTPDAGLLYLPSGKYLKVAALGFDNLAADLLYLWSIQFYADKRIVSRYHYLEHIYGIITDLDPAYIDAYVIGALIIGLEGNDVETALRILNKGMAANPDKWILAANAGYFAWLDLQDYALASEYFHIASRAKDCSPPIRRLFGIMLEKAGDTRSSLAFWQEIHRTSDDKNTKRISLRFIRKLIIKLDIETLNGVINNYGEKTGRTPASWQALISSGYLAEVPLSPDGEPYILNRETGIAEDPSENAY